MSRGAWSPTVIVGGGIRLRDVDLVDLGVHDPPSASWRERRAAGRVAAAVRGDGRLVAVVGPPLSGKSHTLARAARGALGEHGLVRPDDPHTVDLAALAARASAAPGPAVVWLDDAPPSLLDQITPALVAALPAGVRVLLTATTTRIPALFPDPGTRALLDDGTCARLPALRPRRGVDPLAAMRPALEEIAAALTPGMFMTPDVAVLRAVVDIVRTGWPGPVPLDTLVRIAHREGYGFVDPTEALEPLRHRLIAGRPALWWSGRGEQARPRTHPLAVAATELVVGADWSPPVPTDVLDDPDPTRRWVVGRTLLAQGGTAAACRLLHDVDPASVPPGVALELGLAAVNVLDDGDDADLGRAWFRRAADDPSLAREVHRGLGSFEADYLRDPVAAEAHLRAVVDEPGVRWQLAWLAEGCDDLEGARAWQRELLEHGDAGERRDAVEALARLADTCGDLADARHWYARGREAGPDLRASFAWARMELRHGMYDRVPRVLDGAYRPTGGDAAVEAGALLAAAALLGGDPDGARRYLPASVTTSVWALQRGVELFAVLLRSEGTQLAARALARDPRMPWFERGPVRCLVTAVVADQEGDHAEARARYREVVADAESDPVVAGIARYGLARLLPFPDAPEARRLRADLLADERPELRELGLRLRP